MQNKLDDKFILITGATSGIGFETALYLSGQGANVILAGRNETRCQKSITQILEAHPNAYVDYLVADLSVLEQTRRMAEAFLSRYRRLDVLINNAGAIFLTRRYTPDGLESTFAVNHLSVFLLTELLMETVKTTAKEVGEARIINVSSNAHYGAKINFNDLGSEYNYHPMRVYGMSKLANVLHAFELDRRLKGQGITVNALHPGLVATNIGTYRNPILRLLSRVFLSLWTVPASEGAKTSIFLASSPEVKDISGAFFIDSKEVRADPIAYDEIIAQRLWQVSSKMVGIGEPVG